MRIARPDVAGWIDRLAAVFNRPDGPDDELVTTYYEALRHLPREAVEDAVQVVLRTEERYWPKPATLVRHARARMPQQDTGALTPHQRWLSDPFHGKPGTDESQPCPDCGSVWRWMHRQREDGTWTPARLHIRCDTERHRHSHSRPIATYQPGEILKPADPAITDTRTLEEIKRDMARHVTLPEPVKQKASDYEEAA